VLLLRPYKDGDANVRSVWLYSRNDAIGNVIVMLAALVVWGTATSWPDLLVAAVIAGVFLTSSVQIVRQAWAEYRESAEAHPVPAVYPKGCFGPPWDNSGFYVRQEPLSEPGPKWVDWPEAA
jgi:Co/Zn/Cd efflux system component